MRGKQTPDRRKFVSCGTSLVTKETGLAGDSDLQKETNEQKGSCVSIPLREGPARARKRGSQSESSKAGKPGRRAGVGPTPLSAGRASLTALHLKFLVPPLQAVDLGLLVGQELFEFVLHGLR